MFGGRHQTGGILDGLYSACPLPENNVGNIADDLHIRISAGVSVLDGHLIPARGITCILFPVNVVER